MSQKLERVGVPVLVDDKVLCDRIAAMLARQGAAVSSCGTAHALDSIGSEAIASVDVAAIDPDAEYRAVIAATVALEAARPGRCPRVASGRILRAAVKLMTAAKVVPRTRRALAIEGSGRFTERTSTAPPTLNSPGRLARSEFVLSEIRR